MVRRRGFKILLIPIMVLALLAAGSTAVDYLLGAGYVFPGAAVPPSEENDPPERVLPGNPWKPFWPEPPLIPRPEKIKGIYVTGYTAGKGHFSELLDLIDRTELNSVVVDLKDDNGYLTYSRTGVPWVAEAGLNRDFIDDAPAFVRLLEQRGVYPIARIVAFKDSAMARYFPERAIQHRQGGLWRDAGGDCWLDPYNKENWKYVVAVAREAAQLGFREIQFDYVRFPDRGNLSAALYPSADGTPFNEVIPAFLHYARASLEEYRGVELSIDIFGWVIVDLQGAGIGQHLESLAGTVDIVCPMLYPSHFEAGNLGLADPAAAPYETVYRSLAGAQHRLLQAGTPVALRPWIQSFSYGSSEIRAQINAAGDLGIDEFMLWNAANYYIYASLRPAGPKE